VPVCAPRSTAETLATAPSAIASTRRIATPALPGQIGMRVRIGMLTSRISIGVGLGA
jgi:hypothetical protein